MSLNMSIPQSSQRIAGAPLTRRSFVGAPLTRSFVTLPPTSGYASSLMGRPVQLAPSSSVFTAAALPADSAPPVAERVPEANGSPVNPPIIATQKTAAIAVEETPWGGGCPWQSDKTAFKNFCKAAIQNPRGKERKELYGFLAECFLDADSDRDGFVSASEFDFLCEKSAALPRRFGLAPSWTEMYGDEEHRRMDRATMFAQVDRSNRGFIGLEDWVAFSIEHITDKVRTISNTVDFAHLDRSSSEEFVDYCEVAVTEKHSEQYKSLHEHLFKVFVESDVEEMGMVHWENFDRLIEDAAKCPRAAGLAPTTAEAYRTEEEKLKGRKAEWDAMETSGRGAVTFDEFLTWASKHIVEKVADYRAGKGYMKPLVAATLPDATVLGTAYGSPHVTAVTTATLPSPISPHVSSMMSAPILTPALGFRSAPHFQSSYPVTRSVVGVCPVNIR